MDKKPRGICIIINNTFAIGEARTPTGKKLEERCGTNVDKDRLKRLLNGFIFKCMLKLT